MTHRLVQRQRTQASEALAAPLSAVALPIARRRSLLRHQPAAPGRAPELAALVAVVVHEVGKLGIRDQVGIDLKCSHLTDKGLLLVIEYKAAALGAAQYQGAARIGDLARGG